MILIPIRYYTKYINVINVTIIRYNIFKLAIVEVTQINICYTSS